MRDAAAVIIISGAFECMIKEVLGMKEGQLYVMPVGAVASIWSLLQRGQCPPKDSL